jgi:hypothetical protein
LNFECSSQCSPLRTVCACQRDTPYLSVFWSGEIFCLGTIVLYCWIEETHVTGRGIPSILEYLWSSQCSSLRTKCSCQRNTPYLSMFWSGEIFCLGKIVLYCWIEETHVIAIEITCKLKYWVFFKMLSFKNWVCLSKEYCISVSIVSWEKYLL